MIHTEEQYQLGATSDRIAVSGNLTLSGTLNVSAVAGFGAGTYTLCTYSGTLAGSGLALGSMPPGYVYMLDTATAGQVKLVVMTDSVGDGIPNQWRQEYFGGDGTTTNGDSSSASDPDHDGANNYHEFLADTNPTNPLSYFCIQALQRQTSPGVSFLSSTARVYTLYGVDNLRTNGWANVPSQTDVPGVGTNLLFDDTGGGTQRFYRVGVRLP